MAFDIRDFCSVPVGFFALAFAMGTLIGGCRGKPVRLVVPLAVMSFIAQLAAFGLMNPVVPVVGTAVTLIGLIAAASNTT